MILYARSTLSFHFNLLYLLLNSCEGNGHVLTSFYAHETSRLLLHEKPDFISPSPNSPDLNPIDYIIWVLMQECVTRSSGSFAHGQANHKISSMKQLVIGESGYVHAWRQNDITLNICSTKTISFQSQHTTQLVLLRAINSLPRKTYCFASFPLQLFKKQIN